MGTEAEGRRYAPILLTLEPFADPSPTDEITEADALGLVNIDTVHVSLGRGTVQIRIESPRPNVKIDLELVRSEGPPEPAWRSTARADHAGHALAGLDLERVKPSREVYYLTARSDSVGFAHVHVHFH